MSLNPLSFFDRSSGNYTDNQLQLRNHPWHSSTYEVCIQLDYLGTGMHIKEMIHQSSRHGCFKGGEISAISSMVYQGDETLVILVQVYQGDGTSAISVWVYQKGQRMKENKRKGGQGTLINASNSLPLLVLPSPIFPVAFEHHISPAFEHYFFPRPPFPVYRTTYIPRWSYLNVCNRRLTSVSSLRMGCSSTSLLIRDRDPAPHSLRCRRKLSQCSVPTTLILYSFSPLLCAMIVHRRFPKYTGQNSTPPP